MTSTLTRLSCVFYCTLLCWSCLIVFGSPSAAHSSSSATSHGALETVQDAVAHPLHAHPQLHGSPDSSHLSSGSLHGKVTTPASHHPISSHARQKAEQFVAHLDHLVAGLKAKSHLARLTRKYPPGSNATHAQQALQRARDEVEEAEEQIESGEEDEFGRRHAHEQSDRLHDASSPAAVGPVHGPAGSPEAHIHASMIASHQQRQQKASKAHIPHPELPKLIQTVHIPDHDVAPSHPVLSPVPKSHKKQQDERRRKNQAKKRTLHENDDQAYVLHPIQLAPTQPSPSGFNFTTFVYPTIQGNVTIFVGITEYPLGKFHFYPSPRDEIDEISLITKHHQPRSEKAARRSMRNAFLELHAEIQAKLNPLCDGVAMTSVSAANYGCLFAQNAGFFNMQTNGCLGNIVSADQWINHATPDLVNHSHFGFTRKGNFISGYMTEEEVASGVDGGFHELTQGSGWLVRDGVNYIQTSAQIEGLGSGFVTEKAPRNAIGHDIDGRLLMFEADGEEDIKLGLTLLEFADILTHHFQVENAINVDGGGSSTTVYRGEVIDRPTCRDTPQLCERPVTTISCVLP